MIKISYKRYRFPAVIIQNAVWLYFRFPLSYRNVEDLLEHFRGSLKSTGHCHGKW